MNTMQLPSRQISSSLETNSKVVKEMNGILAKVTIPLLAASVIGLFGFVMHSNTEIAILTQKASYQEQQNALIRSELKEIREDVKEMRRIMEERAR